MTAALRTAARLLAALALLGCSAEPEPRLLAGVGFVRLAAPLGGAATISDLVSHDGRLYGVASRQPLGGREALLFATADGTRIEGLLDPGTSEGLLRIRRARGRLWVPDADPTSRDAGRVYEIAGPGAPRPDRVADALHTYDVVDYGGELLSSNGMRDGRGALLAQRSANDWSRVATSHSRRLKWLVAFRGSLFAAIRPRGATADYLRWRDAPARGPGEAVDAVPGEAVTFRWYVSERGSLFWSRLAGGRFGVQSTADGERWTDVPSLADRFVSAFAELDGALYALSDAGLHGSRDHVHFELVAPAPGPAVFGPARTSGARANSDATASLAVHAGALWSGSSTDGHLYRLVRATTSQPKR